MISRQVSIVVPVLNEEANVADLIQRFDLVLKKAEIEYEIIFIDDHSTDQTKKFILQLAASYPIFLYDKRGTKGKAYSLIEGFQYVRYPYIAMIDADLQYPPEAVTPMLKKIEQGFDIIVANRVSHKTSWLRKIISNTFDLLFSKILHDLHCDVQSGLKVFRRKIVDEVKIDPSPWTFDLEFLLKSRNYGYRIGNQDIVFAERKKGASKIVLLKAIWEIGCNAIKHKFKRIRPLSLPPENTATMIGAGLAHRRKRFITHTTLQHGYSALETFSLLQRLLFGALILLLLAGLIISPLKSVIALVAALSALYFIDVFFNLYLVSRSLKKPPEIVSSSEEIKALDETELPVYSVLCPMYREANMLPGFVEAIGKLEWPKKKLDVLLLLEENDLDTITAAQAMNLPDFFRILIVPHSMPKTKPKACNYGLAFARGEYVVIYDAEDLPDILQLKKAYLGFQKSPDNVRCLQAKLNYFNPKYNLLTKLFTAEYSLWFDLSLPGLQSVNTSIPLGGTSNHFRTKDLLALEGWDPFNVTEDCDLGVRLFKRGYRTAIIDSVTLEEANSQFHNWLRQRSRWIKGYMQTYLVHMRQPLKFFRENGIHAFLFQLVVGGKIAFIFINPFLWLSTIAYFALNQYVGSAIEALYPGLVFYLAVISLVFGNFLAMYYYMIGCAKRGHWSIIKYVFLVPIYWLLVSLAGFIALYQLLVKPHYWEKTNHGLAIKKIKSKAKAFSPVMPVPGLNLQKKLLTIDLLEHSIEDRLEGMRFAVQQKLLLQSEPAQKLLKYLFSSQGIIIIAITASNFLNFIFNAYLARSLSYPQLSVVILASTFWSIATIFIGALSGTISHRVSYFVAKNSFATSRRFFDRILKNGVYLAGFFCLLWLVLSPLLAEFFQLPSSLVLALFAPAFLFGLWAYSLDGFFKGNLRFIWSAAVILTDTVSKLCFAVFFTLIGRGDLAYLAIPMSLLISAIVGSYFVRQLRAQPVPPEPIRIKDYFPSRFFLSSILTNISSIVFLSVDILLVNHFFAEESVGQYSILSLAGKMIFFLGTMPLVFMIPYVSRNDGLGLSSKKLFQTLLLIVSGLASFGMLIFGLFGFFTVPLLFGAKALAIVPLLPLYTFSIAIFTITNVVVVYHLAKRHYIFPLISLCSSLALILGIYFEHENFAQVVRILFFSSSINLLIIGSLHYFEKSLPFLNRSLVDLWGIFINGLPKAQPRIITGKRLLIFNWRDTTHAFAGGAEVYVHEIAKFWVKHGNHVTLFCGNDGKQSRHETINGVNIVRRGGFYLVYLWAFLYYIFRFRGKYDLVVDCENGIPFFTPLYVGVPIFTLLHHVHQEVFYRSLAKPLAWLACFLEKDLMPLIYRNVKFITVSESSFWDMEKIGIGKAGIHIINPGINPEDFSVIISEKTQNPTILFLGRLKAYKSVNILIQAFCNVIARYANAKLIIAGGGEEEKNLKNLARQLNLSKKQVVFLGKISEADKIRLLQSSWMLVNPSFMEGWGIVNIEANACGTPVIASNVPGLRDSVKNGKAGFLLPYGDVSAFTDAMLQIIQNRAQRESMSTEARSWAGNFDWQKSAQTFLSVINDE